jgi:hypothetical protein
MKRFLITLCAVAALSTSVFPGNNDRIEIGAFITKSGVRIPCVYLIRKGHDTEVHLLFPDGRDVQVDVEAETFTRTIDRTLQQIADDQ